MLCKDLSAEALDEVGHFRAVIVAKANPCHWVSRKASAEAVLRTRETSLSAMKWFGTVICRAATAAAHLPPKHVHFGRYYMWGVRIRFNFKRGSA